MPATSAAAGRSERPDQADHPPDSERDAREHQHLLGKAHRSEQQRADDPCDRQRGRSGGGRPDPRGMPAREELTERRSPAREGDELPDRRERSREDPARTDHHHQGGGQPGHETGLAAETATRRRIRGVSRLQPERSGRGLAERVVVTAGELFGVCAAPSVLEHAPGMRGEPGAAADLQQADLLVAESPQPAQLRALPAHRTETTEVPPPGPDDRPGPVAAACQLRDDHLCQREDDHLGHHPQQVEPSVALEHREQLVAALELLQRDRMFRRRCSVLDQCGFGRAPSGGQLLEVPHAGVGRDDDPGPGHLGPPAEVEVLAHRDDRRIEPLELLEEVGTDEHAPAGRKEDVSHRVVLAVVDLVGVHTVDDCATLVDGHAHVDQAIGVAPAHDLRRHDAGVRAERLFHQEVDRVGKERDVVVAEHVVRGAVDHRADLVDRGPEAAVLLEPADVCGRQYGCHPGGEVIVAGRVENQHRELPVVLGGERGQGLFEPRARVVGDDDGDDRRSQCFHQGSEAIGRTWPFGGP